MQVQAIMKDWRWISQRKSWYLNGEFGSVQGDHFHGGDDTAGFFDLPSDYEVKVGLFHQVVKIVPRLNRHQLLHTCNSHSQTFL